jgi:hypothetical protein
MRLLVSILFLSVIVAGCTPKASNTHIPAPVESALYPDLGQAPELTNTVWLNTETPLRLADLRGKVVLIDMWTFG